jgi:hypothetical protein
MKPARILMILLFAVSLACNLPARLVGFTPPPPLPASLGTPAASPIVASCTRHVAPGGSDASPGDSAAPWKTLQHAADAAKPGDTVCIHAGDYRLTDEVLFAHSGAPDAPILFAGAPGEQVVLRGSLYIQRGVAYITLVGFTLRDFRVWGITLQGNNHHIVLSGLTVAGGEAGIRLTEGDSGQSPAHGPVHDILIEASVISHSMYTALDCTPGPCNNLTVRGVEIHSSGIEAGYGGDGLGIERGSNILVEDCNIHDNGGDGIDLNSRDFGGNIPGILVRRNRVVRNHLQGIKLWAGGRMENNLVWGQGVNPVMAGKYPSIVEIVNNTVAFNMFDPAYSARDYSLVVGYPEEGRVPKINLVLVNNIFAFNTGPGVGSPTGIYIGPAVKLTERNNLFWSREDEEIQADFVSGRETTFSRGEITGGVWAKVSGQGQRDIAADPRFLSPWPRVDLHLGEGSPALNAGFAGMAPAEDAEMHPRGAPPDIGASPDIGALERP